MDQDQQAIQECQAGISDSYRFLVDKYQERAFYAALLMTGNREDAIDLSQEAFFRAFKAIKSFQLGKNFYTWFYRILKNICINHYKRIKRRNVVFSDAQKSTVSDLSISPLATPDQIFEEHEMRDLLWKALIRLKAADREIILMKEFNEMSYKEISEVLEIPIGSVMSRLFYARKKLALLLEEFK